MRTKNPSMLGYDEENRRNICADFVEILANGYTTSRAIKLLHHWSVSEESHKNILNEEIPGPHYSIERSIPALKTFYVWRHEDKEFHDAWTEAIHRGTEALEDHALDMAFAGNDKLVMFLLKARNPAKYANFGALGGGSFNISITPTDEGL